MPRVPKRYEHKGRTGLTSVKKEKQFVEILRHLKSFVHSLPGVFFNHINSAVKLTKTFDLETPSVMHGKSREEIETDSANAQTFSYTSVFV